MGILATLWLQWCGSGQIVLIPNNLVWPPWMYAYSHGRPPLWRCQSHMWPPTRCVIWPGDRLYIPRRCYGPPVLRNGGHSGVPHVNHMLPPLPGHPISHQCVTAAAAAAHALIMISVPIEPCTSSKLTKSAVYCYKTGFCNSCPSSSLSAVCLWVQDIIE